MKETWRTSRDREAMTAEQLAGRELRRLRTGRGWSQEEAARRMNAYGYDWHQTTVAKTEAAQRPLRLNELADMCKLYGVTPGAVLGNQTAEAELLAAAQSRIVRLERQIARISAIVDGDE